MNGEANTPSDDTHAIGFARLDLARLKEWAETKGSEWDGDNPGVLEDIAHCASDIISNIDELSDLLDEMEELLNDSRYPY